MQPVRSGKQLLIAFLLVLSGCRSTAPAVQAPATSTATHVIVSDSVGVDAAIEAVVATYRQRLQEKVGEVIGTAAGSFRTGKPEGALGNLAADALLAAASPYNAQIALTNNGGLRVPIEEGPVTVGDLYELMPFENKLAMLTLTGVQVDTLVQQLARIGGEPVAGISFVISGGRASDVRVGGQRVNPTGTYRLATSDYLAGVGGSLSVLQQARREETPVLLRDAFIEYIRKAGTIRPMLDGRIRRQ